MRKNNFIKIKYYSSYDPTTVDVHLSKSNGGNYFIDYYIQDSYEDIEKHDKILEKDSKDIDNILINSRIPIITEGNIGMDGNNIEITLKNSGNEVTYKWWKSPNSAWEPLEELVKIISKYLPFDLYN